jgi:hypothetical protein
MCNFHQRQNEAMSTDRRRSQDASGSAVGTEVLRILKPLGFDAAAKAIEA